MCGRFNVTSDPLTVLLMELVCDEHGDPAPQLGEVEMSAAQAIK